MPMPHGSNGTVPDRYKRPRLHRRYRVTALRKLRMHHGLRQTEVATEADVANYRLSLIERAPTLAFPGEIEQIENAIRRLAAHRK